MRIGGRVLIGLGVFLLVLGVLALTYAPGALKRTPLKVNTLTQLEGQAARQGAVAEPLVAQSINQVDGDASDGDTAVFGATTCAVFSTTPIGRGECPDPETDPSVLTVTQDVFATDRVSAEAVDDAALPDDAIPHEGLVNKWPFGAEQRTYPYWDGVLQRAVDADFDRTAEIDGNEYYVYRVDLTDEPAVVATLGDTDVMGTYSDVKEIFVDPGTGSIVNQTESQTRELEDGTTALVLNLAFTDDQVATNVADAEANNKSLDVVLKGAPVVGLVGGVLFILGGVLMIRRGNRRNGPQARAHREKATAAV